MAAPKHSVSVPLTLASAVAAGVGFTQSLAQQGPGKYAIESASIRFSNAITANDTNFSTYTLTDGSTTLASFTTETTGSGGVGNITGGDVVAFVLQNSESNAIAQSGKLNVVKADSGSGQILGVYSSVNISWEGIRA